ncbi:MAG TPA: hypothetical protein VIS07_15725 [Candidatus Binatia bacterium]|uniref:DUF370 domain-containing protein n=1 Tax=Geochorda subterranea TaxID=3109564 RepID=A0ABZ1BQE7_9FIRM|nr:hypothetical protein [Limnochorda sp. LNt]WRP14641.1 hypothetical protein VLY81_00275 [Limnochorda sp. LNt]
MYVHLGDDVVIRARDVVAIVDLAALQRRGLALDKILGSGDHVAVTWVGDGVGTSLVVTPGRLYVSPISPMTLRRRASMPWSGERDGDGSPVVVGRGRRRAGRRRRRGA